MTRGRRVGAAVVLLVALLTTIGAPALAQEAVPITDVETGDYPEVVVEFSAPPGFGGIELGPDDITLTEDGSQRGVTVTRETAENIEIILAIDTSGSMTGAPIEQARVAARSFVELLPSDTQVALIGFGDTPVILSDFVRADQVLPAIDAIAVDPAAETTVYDAVRLAAQQFPPVAQGPRYILVVTDGGDTASEADLGTAQAAVQAAEIPVFAVSLVTSESDPASLQALTAETGGGVVEATDPDGLGAVTNEIASAISAQYSVRYDSEANGRTVISIDIVRDGLTASGQIGVDLPLVLEAAATTTPVPTAAPTPTPTPRAEVAAPPPIVIDSDTSSWLLPVGIALVAGALVVLFNFLLWPTRKRRNPLRDVKPVAGRAGNAIKSSGGVLSQAAASLLGFAERIIANRDEKRLAQKLDRAGVRMRPAEYLVTLGLAVAVALLVGLLFSRGMALLLALLTLGGGYAILNILGERRSAEFEQQLASTLQMMSGALRAGFSISQVVDLVSREASSPTRDEFARLAVEENLGRDISESFKDVGHRMQSEDFEWVAEAIDINRSIGGDLSEVLENVSQTIRTRQSIQREIKTLAAEGKLSAMILIAVPFIIALGQFAINPELSSELTGTGEGRVLIVIGLAMISIGAYWMKRIVRLKY